MKGIGVFRLGKLFAPANRWRMESLDTRAKTTSSLWYFAADILDENHGWRSTHRRDTYSVRREHPMPVDVIHAVMGVVFLLTWVCIGQMNIRRRVDPDAEARRHFR